MTHEVPSFLVTGLAQGADPAGGVAVARALRAAWPKARIIGQDYSVRAAGLHDPVFDDVVVHRPWGEFDTAALEAGFAERLAAGTLILSTIDLESYWLARHFPAHPSVLSPPAGVFAAVCKPVVEPPALADLCLPDAVSLAAGMRAVHAFLRRNGGHAWLKGPFHDALRVRRWEAVHALIRRLARWWPFGGAHLQAHKEGSQEALAFAALNGRLIEAIWLVKNEVTNSGKTVAGTQHPLTSSDRMALSDYVAGLNWTGGGEIELIRDREGRLWLMEINPRFPAWSHGAALLGINLPASLAAAARDDLPPPALECPRAAGFVRVQKEIATRAGFDLLPPIVPGIDEPPDGSKVAFSIHEIAQHLRGTVGLPIRRVDTEPNEPLPNLPEPAKVTPHVHFLSEDLWLRLTRAASATQRSAEPAVRLAYSVKTNPDPRVLDMVHEAGLWVEVIGPEEYALARGAGFPDERIVVNGPTKPGLDDAGVVLFADSLEEAETRGVAARRDFLFGLRLRPPGIPSRFGIELGSPETVLRLHRLVAGLPTGTSLAIHMHISHALVGCRVWRAFAETLVDEACVLQGVSGHPVTILDLGGGCHPGDFDAELAWVSGPFRDRASMRLPHLQTIILEPGRALVQGAFAVETSVVSVRADATGNQDVIVDTSIASLPETGHYPHRVCRRNSDRWERLEDAGAFGREGRGVQARLLGATCMEDDVLVSDLAAAKVAPGDRLLVLDAGSYDRSMAYAFGRGRACAP